MHELELNDGDGKPEAAKTDSQQQQPETAKPTAAESAPAPATAAPQQGEAGSSAQRTPRKSSDTATRSVVSSFSVLRRQ